MSPNPDHLSVTFAALADPTRRAILARLAKGDATVNELHDIVSSRSTPLSLPALSKHLKVLERAKLISRSVDAQRRPCRIAAAPLKEVSEWTEKYRQLWEERFDRLDDYLQELKKEHGRGNKRGPK